MRPEPAGDSSPLATSSHAATIYVIRLGRRLLRWGVFQYARGTEAGDAFRLDRRSRRVAAGVFHLEYGCATPI